jgi:hypothetical protein
LSGRDQQALRLVPAHFLETGITVRVQLFGIGKDARYRLFAPYATAFARGRMPNR